MKHEKSCGAVVFTRVDGEIRYLLIKSLTGTYGFPKGHVEENETEQETAKREVLEETSLHVELLNDFREEDTYSFKFNCEIRMKHIVYFLARFSDQIPVAQETELNSIHLMDYESALSSLQFKSSKRILTAAHKFLTS